MPAVWNPQANSIFLQSLEQPPAERETFLVRACGSDAALAEQARSLLAASEQAGSFLETPPTAVVKAMSADTDQGTVEMQDLGFLSASERPDSLGRLKHYEILGIVGSGGFGVVLKAFDEQLHRIVAIKALKCALAASPAARKQFVREARAAAAVSHENVVDIYAVEEAGPVPYLVMKYVDGVALEEKLQANGALELTEVLRIGLQIAAGLAAAHKQGLVHRDVKPANILLENGVERVKITDFGLAQTVGDAEWTEAGVIAGTPPYMSPEQARGKPVDFRSDLFSLGSVLYAMCAGRAPFRGESSLTVLRIICGESPEPVRAWKPEAPEWLEEIIGKLHAKEPAERFQSAAEVADLLTQRLAELRHGPGLAPSSRLPAKALKLDAAVHQPSRRWIIPAAALVCLLVALGLTETTGATRLATTVVRIFTAEGTLVVETDDPAVKVTIEGDGGLVITGAGPQEVRLRPGSYKVRATRDGKPVLAEELIEITRGGRQIVRVRLEGGASQAAIPAKAEPGAFVLLGGDGVAERKCDTLAEAVVTTTDGDIIEIRGNGPFECDGVTVKHPLVIRAGEGYTPSIALSQASAEANVPLITASAALILEGLELRRIGGSSRQTTGRHPALVAFEGASKPSVLNCRLIFKGLNDGGSLISVHSGSAGFTVRNCELYRGSPGITLGWWAPPRGAQGTIENCACANGSLWAQQKSDVAEAVLRVNRNTLADTPIVWAIWDRLPDLPVPGGNSPPIQLTFAANVAANRRMLWFGQFGLEPPLPAREAEALLPRLIDLQEQDNLYPPGMQMLQITSEGRFLEGATRGHDLADWNHLWDQQDTGSVEGTIRFQGGDLAVRGRTAPEQLTAEDFRLRPDSAGYRAGPDGKDLGADVDFVGPGAAYERWKMTPDYQEWPKNTGQAKDVSTVKLTPEARERASAELFLQKGAKIHLESPEGRPRVILDKSGQWPAGKWGVVEVVAAHLGTLTVSDLALLRDFPLLKGISLNSSPVTTAALLDQVEGQRLTLLNLNAVPTTENDVARLAEFTGLYHLFLYETGLSDDDVALLAKLPLLRKVNFGGNPLTDQSLEYLSGCPQLERLYLSNTKVTDEGLTHLHQCKSLQFLDVSATFVSPRGVADLRKALPGCEVNAERLRE